MSDDELERLLGDAFDRSARGSVPDGARSPRARFLDDAAPAPRRRLVRLAAPLAAAAAVVAIVTGALLVSSGDSTQPSANRRTSPAPGTSATGSPSSTSSGSVAVHVRLDNADHREVGVGMPIVARFSKAITNGAAFAHATTLTVDGRAAAGAWYFERSASQAGYPLEAHFRMPGYWPANAQIHLGLPVRGLSGGSRFAFDDSLSLDFRTGPAQIATVDDVKHQLTLRRDGSVVGVYPVSLGASSTPTTSGTKVIMAKGADISMRGPGYYDPHVKWTQRLTYSGEYLHAAPWNAYNIEHGIDSSNGCTNLDSKDAKTLYGELRVGDVVVYPNASGPHMTMAAGLGDWNVAWRVWTSGGAVPTT